MAIHTYHSAFKRLTAVKAMPAGSRPPAAGDSVRISTGGRYGGFGASVPLLTKPSLMHFSGAKGSTAILPKLVKLVGPSSTLLLEELSPFTTQSAAEAPSVRLQALVSGSTSASLARRGCRALYSRLLLNADLTLPSSS